MEPGNQKAVEAADAILVCLSNNSITKEGYLQRELRIVLDYADYKPEGTLYLIPMRLEDCEPPRRLRPWQYADYFPPERRERAFGRLILSLRMRAEALGIPVGQTDISSHTPSFVSAVERPAENPALPLDRLMIAGMEFCRIPAGRFIMGSKDYDSEAFDIEKPQYSLEIPYVYWLARFPVTNEQYNLFLKAGNLNYSVSSWEESNDYSVVNVSWQDVQNYTIWLNETQTADLPTSHIYRLPTEAEWEKAARGTYRNIYPWGNEFDLHKCNSAEGICAQSRWLGCIPPRVIAHMVVLT